MGLCEERSGNSVAGMMERIAIIGNGGGGKSTLARRLGSALGVPVHHVDSIQFQPGWTRTPKDACDRALDALARGERWIIDGFGSDEVIERRLRAADTVIFVDFPIWIHYWWAARRQWHSRHGQRTELPPDCPEFTWRYSWRLLRVMWEVYRHYQPWFRKLLRSLPSTTTVHHLRSPRELNEFLGIVERPANA